MRTKDDFIYYRECLFCGERFVSNRSNKTPIKFKRIGIEGARPETMCCNGRCAALRKAHGTFERYVLAEQMEDAAAMLAEQSSNQWRRMVSPQCVNRVRRQVAEMLKRLHKKCKQCEGTAEWWSPLCTECAKERDKQRHRRSGHKARCRTYGCEYRSGIKLSHIIERDGCKCHWCKVATTRNDHNSDDQAEIDHVMPISKGGGHVMENIVVSCRKCNNKKADRILALC